MTTHVQDVLNTSYILSDEQYKSSTSIIAESKQSDNDEFEELERYRNNDPIFESSAMIKNLSDVCFFSKNYQFYVAWEQFDSYLEM